MVKQVILSVLMIALATSLSFAQQHYNYAFPSPMPPTGDTAGVKQIVSFIWDDNAYSGKNGSNYEGEKWRTGAPDANGSKFALIGWVGGYRAEAAWIFAPQTNDLNVKEGDFGMSWATKKLSGYSADQIHGYPMFNPQFAGAYKEGDRVLGYSDRTKEVGVYEVIVNGTAHSIQISPSSKSIDDVAIGPDDQTCKTNWQTMQQECSPITDWRTLSYDEKNLLVGKGKMLVKVEGIGITNGSPVKKNPDASNISMTFNIISGQIIPAINRTPGNVDASANRESKWGYWVPNSLYGSTVFGGVAIAWGREYPIFLASGNSEKDKQFKTGYYMDYGSGDGLTGRMQVLGFLNTAYQEAADLGHEIGNHTIDHLETNSMLPYGIGTGAAAFPGFARAADNSKLLQSTSYKEGFARWGGEGYDAYANDTADYPDGYKYVLDEAYNYGQTVGAPQQFMGWKADIGRILSREGWRGLIQIGEEEIHNYLDISKNQGSKVSAFRAPRLEVNSAMFYALKDEGYLYDTGNEEGYEYNMDGTNYLWPYTMDNGSPNVAWQRMAGTNRSSWDSLPYELWQYPVSVLIIPDDYREIVWNNYYAITTGALDGTKPTDADRDHFLKIGKLTGFDFNLFILNGATKEAAIATMRNSLDQRMKGGKAPFQVGCHTDYFTPIYDNATLLNAVNEKSYGLVIKNNWNTWKDRIAVFEDLVDYGLSKGAYFYNGKQAIDYVKDLVSKARVGQEKKTLDNWTFFSHNDKSTSTGTLSGGADIITVQTEADKDMEVAGFASYGSAGQYQFDHISFEYSTTAPITVRLITDDAIDGLYPYEITLSNLNGFYDWNGTKSVNKSRFVKSGQIPLSAFQRNQYVALDDNYKNLTGLQVPGTDFTARIKGIEISVQTPLVSSLLYDKTKDYLKDKIETQKNWISVKNFTLYSGEQTQGVETGIANLKKMNLQKTAVLGMNANTLKLNIVNTGVYNVDIITANGRLVKSFKNVNLNTGANNLSLNGMAKGMYLIRIHNKNFNTSLKSLVM